MRKAFWSTCIVLALCLNLGAAETTPGVHVDTLSKTSSSWDGTALPRWAPGTPEITILRITIAPGAELPLHEHPVINAGVLLSGRLKVTKEDGATLFLKAGDPIVEVVDSRHMGKNDGDIPAEIIVFYAGRVNTPVTVIEGQEKGPK